MSKKFVEVISTDDDSDPEIQIVPVPPKPPPPVIDLIVSSDDDCEAKDDSYKLVGKKKNRKKSKNYQNQPSTSSSSAARCDSNVVQPSNNPHTDDLSLSSTKNVGQNERMLIHALSITTNKTNNGRFCEEAVDTTLNVEPIVQNNQGLKNVGGINTLQSGRNDDSIHHQSSIDSQSETSLPFIRIASSIFEHNDEVLDRVPTPFSVSTNNATGCENNNNNSSIVVGGNQEQQGWVLPRIGGGQVKNVAPAKRKRKTNPTTKSMMCSGINDPDRPTPIIPRKRVSKQQKARQRTNEEINNFLTTLGIFEPSEELAAAPVAKRVRKSKKSDSFSVPPEAEALSLIPPPPLISEPEVLSIPIPIIPQTSEVVVLEDQSPAKPKSHRLEKEKQSNDEKEEAAVPEVDTIKTTTAPTPTLTEEEIITPIRILNAPVSIPRVIVGNNNELGILTRTERAALSFNISSVLTSEPDPPPKTTVESIPQTTHTSTSTELQLLNRSIEEIPANLDNNENIPIPIYLPSHWTPQMVKLYDSSSTIEFRLSRALANMPDDPVLWETNEFMFTGSRPQINKRMRCVNCNQFGHVIWKCTEKRKKPVCTLCGQEGHGGAGLGREREKGHSGCPNSMCFNCGRNRPRTDNQWCRHCMFNSRPPICELCNTVGHGMSSCPDNWRRFFSTTTTTPPTNGNMVPYHGDKPVYRLRKDSYCCNCGQKGHTYVHCRLQTRGKYPRQDPTIVNELPQLPKQKTPPETTSTETVSSILNQLNNNKDIMVLEEKKKEKNLTKRTRNEEVIKILPKPADGNVNKSDTRTTRRCMDPECRNKPKTYCFEMIVATMEHKLLRQAQKENKIKQEMKLTSDQVSILRSRNAIHIFVDDVVQGQVDLLKLISKLKLESNSHEIITLDDDDNEDDVTEVQPIPVTTISTTTAPTNTNTLIKISQQKLTVALLASEWDLIFEESLKINGLINQLTDKFKVNIPVSKDNLTVTIENGTIDNRKLAHKNIVFWLECQAANVDFKMQYRLENHNDWSKKKKRPNQSPRPQIKKFKKRKQKQNNDPVPPSPSSRQNSSRNQSNSANNNSNAQSNNRKKKEKLLEKIRQNRKNRPPKNSRSQDNNNINIPNRYYNFNNQQIPPPNFHPGPNDFHPGPNNFHPGPNNFHPGPNDFHSDPNPNDFHSSFANPFYQPQQQQQGPPQPLMQDFIAFRYDGPPPPPSRRFDNRRGSGYNRHKNQRDGNGNNTHYHNRSQSPKNKSSSNYNNNKKGDNHKRRYYN